MKELKVTVISCLSLFHFLFGMGKSTLEFSFFKTFNAVSISEVDGSLTYYSPFEWNESKNGFKKLWVLQNKKVTISSLMLPSAKTYAAVEYDPSYQPIRVVKHRGGAVVENSKIEYLDGRVHSVVSETGIKKIFTYRFDENQQKVVIDKTEMFDSYGDMKNVVLYNYRTTTTNLQKTEELLLLTLFPSGKPSAVAIYKYIDEMTTVVKKKSFSKYNVAWVREKIVPNKDSFLDPETFGTLTSLTYDTLTDIDTEEQHIQISPNKKITTLIRPNENTRVRYFTDDLLEIDVELIHSAEDGFISQPNAILFTEPHSMKLYKGYKKNFVDKEDPTLVKREEYVEGLLKSSLWENENISFAKEELLYFPNRNKMKRTLYVKGQPVDYELWHF